MHHNLVLDVNNFVFAMRYAKVKNPSSPRKKEKYVTEFIFRESLISLIRHAKMLKVDSIVACIDSPHVWRRDIYKDYKANHTNDLDDVYHAETVAAANMLREFLELHTACSVLAYPRAEADDVIAVWCQESYGVHNTIVSSDRDFVQLINERTSLYSPAQDVFRETDDPSYSLFVKCIRGDSGDNVHSAFPRVRESRLKKAWEDDLEMLNLLETILPDGRKVRDALSFNIALIDLTMQPQDMRDGIVANICSYTPSRYSQLQAMKYLVGVGLKESRDIFDDPCRFFKNPPIFRA